MGGLHGGSGLELSIWILFPLMVSAAMAAGVGAWRTVGGGGMAGLGPAMISRTSSPEQKAGSVPVTITQWASGSRTAWRKARSSRS